MESAKNRPTADATVRRAKAYDVEAIRREHSQAYEPWTTEADAYLRLRFLEGATIQELADEFGRQPSAIRSRLRRLEQSDVSPSGDPPGVSSTAAESPPANADWRAQRPRAGRRWTPDEDQQLLEGIEAHLPLEKIASQLGRGAFSVEWRLHQLGLSQPDLPPVSAVSPPPPPPTTAGPVVDRPSAPATGTMQIVINHLTRMQRGNMCVAGVDLATGRLVRPVWGTNLRTKNLARHGGVFDIANVVELGWTQHCGERPHVEDHRFKPERAKIVETWPAERFWKLLEEHARPTLNEIFGPDLTARGRSCAIDRGCGRISLGCLRLAGSARLYVAHRDGRPHKVRIAFSDGRFDVDVGVTDIRLYGADHVTPDVGLVARVGSRIQKVKDVILSVGVTRAYTSSDEFPPLHWLQVNNLHFADEPCWRLG